MSQNLMGADAPLTAQKGGSRPVLIDEARLRRWTGGTQPKPDPTLWESTSANFRLTRDDQIGHLEEEVVSAYEPVIAELKRRGRGGYIRNSGWGLTVDEGALWRDVAAVRAADRSAFADLAPDAAAFRAQVVEGFRARRQADQDASERGGWTGFIAGSLAGALTDPINLLSMGIGGAGATGARLVAREALINTGVEVAQQPLIAVERAKRDEALTLKEAATNVALAPVVGGLFAGAVEGGRFVAGKLRPKTPDGALADAVDAAVPPAAQDPATAGAVAELRRDDRIARTSPFTPGKGTALHEAKLDAATTALETGRLPPVPRRPVSSAEAAARLAADPWEQMKGRIRRAESGGNDAARNPLSTATGRYQVIDGTWLRKMRQLGETGSDSYLLMKRTNPVSQERVMDALGRDYRAALSRFGFPETAGNMYLMHFAGTGGGTRILRAEPGRAVESILGKAAIDANPFLRGMTAEDLIGWAHRKMGGKAPDGPVLAREGFSDDAAGDAEWAAAQRAVDAEEALIASMRAEREATAFDAPPRAADGPDDDIPFDLDDPRMLDAETLAAQRIDPFDHIDPGDPMLPARSEQWASEWRALRDADGGEVRGALYNDGVGAIDVRWGDATGGLKHILDKHAEMRAQIDALPEIVADMVVESASANRVRLGSDSHFAVIRLDLDGNEQKWLLTAFEKRGQAPGGEKRKAPTAAEDGRAVDGGGDGSPRRGDATDIGDMGGGANLLDLPPALASRVQAIDGDVLTLRDHVGGTVEWNAATEMQRVGKGWRRLGTQEFAGAMEQQQREVADGLWRDYDVLDDPQAATRLDDSLAHDAAMLLEEEPDLILQPADGDGRAEIRLSDAIADADDDMAAVTAARACMAPPGKA